MLNKTQIIKIIVLTPLYLFQLFFTQTQREKAKEREEETQAQTQEEQIRSGQEIGERKIETGIPSRIRTRSQFGKFESEPRK